MKSTGPNPKKAKRPARKSAQSGRTSKRKGDGIALQRILVPVDFTPASEKSAAYAQSLRKQFDAEVILLHVLDFGDLNRTALLRGPLDASSLYGMAVEDSINKLENLGKRTLGVTPGWTVACEVGKTVDTVVSQAEDLGVNMIVLAVHPEHRIRHVICGSKAEQIMRHAHCPVLIVREDEKDFI